ncbi:Uncharacterized protein P5673_013720 [Acropora cervicornis]|uniref:Integrase catalytic domain-containing protein n=1 Tax=Acropora cervicornis TaxID=6130 RepID=A0AAD9V6Q4_ACRCE|nr:Uncharacterized protein P5673_013720 [Acropora cervicornis]
MPQVYGTESKSKRAHAYQVQFKTDQVVGTDIFYVKKRPYLIVVDYFSKFIEVNYLASLTAAETIRSRRSVFTRHEIPEIVRSDNPQYNTAEFAKFAKDWEFKHVTSSLLCAQSNGEAERALQTAKNLLKKEEDPAKAPLAYRSTPSMVEEVRLSYFLVARSDPASLYTGIP